MNQELSEIEYLHEKFKLLCRRTGHGQTTSKARLNVDGTGVFTEFLCEDCGTKWLTLEPLERKT
jgi:hypothetical protein